MPLRLRPILSHLALLLVVAAYLLSFASSSYAQTNTEVNADVVRGLTNGNAYVSPGSAALIKDSSNPLGDLQKISSDLKGKGYTVKIAILDSASNISGGKYKDATTYADYLQSYMGLGKEPVIVLDTRVSRVAVRSNKLSIDEAQQITDAARSTISAQGYMAGVRKIANDTVQKLNDKDSSSRNTTVVIIIVVIAAILLAAFLTIGNLNRKWADRQAKARSLSQQLTTQVLDISDKISFLRVQSASLGEQAQQSLNAGNQSLSTANQQLSTLKSPGFLPLAFQYGNLDHQLSDVENLLEDANSNIGNAQRILDANWSSDTSKGETARARNL